MSFLDTLRQWDKAVTCVDRQDLSEALRIFLAIQEPNSKIYFDIGCLHLLNRDLDAAEKAFDCSIRKDEHLAVAFFQRGMTFYLKERYEESLADFQNAFKALRGNTLIDYKALGLTYKLYACEVLINMALAVAQMGNWKKAHEHLVKAVNYKTDAKLNIIDRALDSSLKQKLFKPVQFPSKVLFRPNKHYVAELEKKDYLGKSKVVASVIPQDAFSGFAPLQPQVEDGPTSPREREVLRALEGEPHTVMFEFVPETSDELAVVPGNIVFVLQKGADNWASVVFNERRGLVPYNYLEPLEIYSASTQNEGRHVDGINHGQGISEPPSREPPTRPEAPSREPPTRPEAPSREPPTRPEAPSREPPIRPQRAKDLQPRSNGRGNAQLKRQDELSTDDSYIVKVRFTFTFVVSVPPGSPYAVLIEKISAKVNLPSTAITLSLTSEVTEESVITASTDMESVWSRASGAHITLWCNAKEQTDEKPQSEINFVALHSYDSSNPEDLRFQQGDTITLLSRVNQDWLEGQCNGNIGIFPASFVEEVGQQFK